MATNGNFAQQEQYKAPAEQFTSGGAPASVDSATVSGGDTNLSKDEVGWYFVEQYYNTLSKSPEKLHLFYSKQSQFVYGLEAEIANVSVGRQAIQERIKQLDFQDCKVRVSNVDSQDSGKNIVIQVIGETSNKSGEPKKFVQTFVLAQQPSGYFVLNDVFRYIDEGEDEATEGTTETIPEESVAAAETTAAAEPEPVDAVSTTEEEQAPVDTAAVDEKLQEASTQEPAAVNGVAAKDAPATEEAKAEGANDADAAAQVIAEEDVKEAEKPQDPRPTPVAKPAAPAAEAAPSEPAAPPKKMTWASRAAAAAAAGPRPVVPLPKTATPPAGAATRAPAPAPAAPAAAAAPAASPAQASATPAAAEPAAAKDSFTGWQTAGADSKRQRPQSISAPVEKDGTLGYVRYVTEKVQESDLRAALSAHGELAHFDISRAKNCAFVEYKTAEGFQAAVAANPHTVNGENIQIEARKHKTYGSGYGAGRGGMSGRGRGNFDGPRGGSRGNFGGQGRGRGAPRGRGSPANA